MAEKLDFGESRTKAVIRTPSLRFEIIRWNWKSGQRTDTIDVTAFVFQFRWMKSTRNPEAGCEILMIPQYKDIHALDELSPMDVVKIYEFNVLKYQGFIRRIAASGVISQDGSPSRNVTLSCASFGALLSEGQLGLNIFIKLGEKADIGSKIKEFSGKMADIIKADKPYSEMVGAVVKEWLSYISKCGGTNYSNYFDTWIDYTSGLQGKTIPGCPKTFYICNVTDQIITLWSILNKLIQVPFTEMWMDCGPRNVWIENNAQLSSKPGDIKLGEEKDYLIIRNTPFDGTIEKGTKQDLWNTLPVRKIPLSYLTRFDLNKTMDESSSFYLVAPSIWNPGELALIAMGQSLLDLNAFNKYLYKPVINDLVYTRLTEPGKTDLAVDSGKLFNEVADKVATLKNWNEKNDEYLSGSFTFMVPSNDEMDPRIGEKLEIEGISDAYFYIEGISHSWNYGGPLISNVSVTRGYGANSKIILRDKIFKRGIFAMGKEFS